jgi:hypothetical protein
MRPRSRVHAAPPPHPETANGCLVFDRAFECFPTDDVLAARTCARTLLAKSEGPPGLLAQARLVLTAACLHVHARIGPDPTFDELRDLLLNLRAGAAAWTALAASPIQFVRYTAAELADSDGGLGSAIDLAVRAVNVAAP